MIDAAMISYEKKIKKIKETKGCDHVRDVLSRQVIDHLSLDSRFHG